MSVISGPASIGSLGAKNPELASSFRRAQWRCCGGDVLLFRFLHRQADLRLCDPWNSGGIRRQQGSLGLGQRGPLWCYAIGQAINGNLSDKFGGRRVMSAGAILSVTLNWATRPFQRAS